MKILLLAALLLTACGTPNGDVTCWTPGAATEQFALSVPKCATPTSTISPVGAYYLDLVATASNDPAVPVGGHSDDRFSVTGAQGAYVVSPSEDGYGQVTSIDETYSSPDFRSVVTAVDQNGQAETATRNLVLSNTDSVCGGTLVTGTETFTYQVLTHEGVVTYTTTWNLYSDCSTLEVASSESAPTSDEDADFNDPENIAAMETK